MRKLLDRFLARQQHLEHSALNRGNWFWVQGRTCSRCGYRRIEVPLTPLLLLAAALLLGACLALRFLAK